MTLQLPGVSMKGLRSEIFLRSLISSVRKASVYNLKIFHFHLIWCLEDVNNIFISPEEYSIACQNYQQNNVTLC